MRWWLKWGAIFTVVVGLTTVGAIQAKTWWELRSIPKYLTALVSRGRIESVVNSTGTIKPVRLVSVGAFTSGPIAKVLVDYNSVVYEDDLLAEIDEKLLAAMVARDRAGLATQQADLERVEALLAQARNNEDRAVKLQKINKDYLSPTEMDQYHFTTKSYEAQRRLSLASIEQARANLQNSEANLDYTKIYSPADGVIVERKVDPGQTVAASFQTPELFTIAVEMNTHMYVYASVDEADVGQIRNAQEKKQPVKFTVDAYPGELFEGTIKDVRLNSTTTQNVVTYPVIIDAPNRGMKLMPGMTANLSFPIEARDNVLRLPSAALRYLPTSVQARPEDRHYVETVPVITNDTGPKRSADEKVEQARNRYRRIVWVQDAPGGLLRAVPVTLGLIENRYAEIVEGDLAEGQAVITGTESAFGR
jgi:HlyD family secretion protein